MTFSLDTKEHERDKWDNTPVPNDIYNLVIEKAELKTTKAGNGKGVSMTFSIVDGEFAGRKLFNWFNYESQSEKAQKIGRAQLAGLARACNGGEDVKIDNPNDFIGWVCSADVYVDVCGGMKGEDVNKIRKFGIVSAAKAVGSSDPEQMVSQNFADSDVPF